MEVLFKPSFLKDFQNLPRSLKDEVRKICTEEFPKAKTLRDVSYNIKPLRGFESYYRLRVGSYRIGFKLKRTTVTFMRVRDRKDIYKLLS